MKYVAYVIFAVAALHAFGSIVGHAPMRLIVSVLIAAVGAVLLVVAKKKAAKSYPQSSNR